MKDVSFELHINTSSVDITTAVKLLSIWSRKEQT